MPSVEAHMLLKAAATATDQGSFTAIAAAYTLDRDKERIQPGAFANTIKAWQDRDRPIPLHWAHKGDAEYVIGSVDPHSMKETDDGLYVEGQLDLEGSDLAKEAWRLVKANTVGLSFGFLAEVTPLAKDGTRDIVDIDLYEVSITPAPANPDTRFLALKSVEKADEKSPEQVQRDLDDMRLEMASKDLPDQPEPEPEPDPMVEWVGEITRRVDLLLAVAGVKELSEEAKESLSDEERQILAAKEKDAEVTDKENPGSRSVDPLRERADALALEVASGGMGSRKPPKVKEAPESVPELPLKELRVRSRDQMLELLSGIEGER